MPSSPDAPAKKTLTRKLAGIGTILTILIVAFAVYYFVHVQRKNAYFAARNLRILATVTAQIEEKLRQPEGAEGTLTRPELVWSESGPAFEPGSVSVEAVVQPFFAQSFVNVFDAVLVADAKGMVQWRSPKSTCSVTRLDQLNERKDFRSVGKIGIGDLQRRSQNTRVELEGREYHLFTQPLTVRTKDGKEAQPWIVAGVVSTTRFTAESVTISYTLLILVLAAFLLIIFTLPFLKLSLLGELQRVHLSDILMLGVSLLCATAIATIIMLDVVAYSRTRNVSDAQLRRLASDIKRHVRDEIGLAYAAMTTLEAKLDPSFDSNEPVPEDLRYDPDVRAYPFFESFSRIRDDGHQRQKWLMDSEGIGPINVASREYFRAAMGGREWSGPRGERYVLEAIRSRTTGRKQAVIAKRATPVSPFNDAVVSLSFPMLSLIDTIVAGDCEFVVIDDKGEVVFHSESQRNNIENFFVETDQSKALRSAVAGRQNEMINFRYWGEDHRAFTTPVDGTPWTLVTFRSKRLLRTLNVETIMITVMFLVIYALGYAIFAGIVAVFAPAYRAPWLWPDRRRGAEYRQLLLAYVAFGVAFAASIYLLRPRGVLVVAAVLPALVLLVTYLRLQRRRSATKPIAIGLAILASTAFFFTAGNSMPETDVVLPPLLVRVIMLAAAAAGVVLALLPARADAHDKPSLFHRMTANYAYLLGGAGLLTLSAIFPTMALYKAAFKIEIESFVKHGQLELVNRLEQRRLELDARSLAPWRTAEVTEARKENNLGLYYRFFLNTEVFRAPNESDARVIATQFDPSADRMTLITGIATRNEGRNPVPRFIEFLLPQYSDHSIRMRELLHSGSADDRWTWRRRGDQLDFHSRSIHGLDLVTTTSVPRLAPRYFFTRDPITLPLRRVVATDHPNYADVRWESDIITRILRAGLIFVVLGIYVAMLLWVVAFLAQKVFLEDVREPVWQGYTLLFAPSIEAALKKLELQEPIDIRIGELSGRIDDPDWQRALTMLDREAPEKCVLIRDLDRVVGNADATKVVLRLFESAAGMQARNVVAITTLSPSLLVETTPELAERWRALLARFVVQIVDAPESKLAEADALELTAFVNGSPEHAAALIRRETDIHDAVVRSLGNSVRAQQVQGREEIFDELGERAERYYAGLWSSCSREEKLVLQHVAADGFANPKDRQVLRRLLARRLLKRGPHFMLMNETFRRYVIAEPRRIECREFDVVVPASAWDRVQKPLIAGLVVAGGFFFLTQREMFDASFAIVSGVAGGIPAALRILGFFVDPKDVGAART